ncbi:hypothetical protein WDU99_17065 [Microbacterium sp. Mu-80]|uniref:WXG100 family type VII secretion target n=1 Tax=Microbacterium bandirmense TaxID=3122050 RepID=A0ABU8LGG4_9MICO
MSNNAVWGANVEELHATAGAFAAAAQQLITVAGRTTLALQSDLTWNGPDGERMRARWRDESLPAMATVAGRLREAGLHLVREAEQQLAVSTDGVAGSGSAVAGAAPSAAGGTAGASGSTASAAPVDWEERLGSIRDVLVALPGQAMLGRVLSELPRGGDDWLELSGAISRAEKGLSGFASVGMTGLDVYSTVADAHGLVSAVENGDVASGIEHGVPLAFKAMGPQVDMTLGTAWSAGTMIGGAINDSMEGTRYGDIVRDMSEGAFDENGAWGMLQVPGILGMAAYEYLTEDRPPTP